MFWKCYVFFAKYGVVKKCVKVKIEFPKCYNFLTTIQYTSRMAKFVAAGHSYSMSFAFIKLFCAFSKIFILISLSLSLIWILVLIPILGGFVIFVNVDV